MAFSEPPRRRINALGLPVLLVGIGLWAYHNSFRGAFLFDDHRHILNNVNVREPSPPWACLAESARPIVDCSFTLNYALAGAQPFTYHAVNLAIHLLAGLLLFGLVRRTLETSRLATRFGKSAPWLALATALLWVVHPLQTQSVTYIVQRAESLMGLCYVATIYCLCRSATSSSARRWEALAVLACGAGMASKLDMMTAPLTALLYDRVFFSGSVRQALRKRPLLYLGLFASMGLGMYLAIVPIGKSLLLPGLRLSPPTILGYAGTQPQIILHYLKLSLWPHPLVFDYLWPVATTINAILWPSLAVGALGLAALWALRRRPPVGFLGAWVFLTLAPSSSVLPIADLAVEHRMYLALAAVMMLLVLAGYSCFRGKIALVVLVGLAAIYGTLTIRRNADYASEWRMWNDVLTKRPNHFRALSSLGDLMRREGRLDEAVAYYTQALRVIPDHPEAHFNLGFVLIRQRNLAEAIEHYRRALELYPEYPEAHNNLGIALKASGKLDEAMAQYREALRLRPDYADAHFNAANVLFEQGKIEEAKREYETTLSLQPAYAQYREAKQMVAVLSR
ncbi:MAG: tetratricopeptide repeat protein [Candidatus Omnitrophica bacterium]|nr:tetratricopeptide repeat protein [Candidatus Omnitrophota bacterium]